MNGAKKWITNGTFCDYFVTGVALACVPTASRLRPLCWPICHRTAASRACAAPASAACKTEKGITLLLIERDDNLTTSPIKTSYSPAAGTSYVLYENVKVGGMTVCYLIRFIPFPWYLDRGLMQVLMCLNPEILLCIH